MKITKGIVSGLIIITLALGIWYVIRTNTELSELNNRLEESVNQASTALSELNNKLDDSATQINTELSELNNRLDESVNRTDTELAQLSDRMGLVEAHERVTTITPNEDHWAGGSAILAPNGDILCFFVKIKEGFGEMVGDLVVARSPYPSYGESWERSFLTIVEASSRYGAGIPTIGVNKEGRILVVYPLTNKDWPPDSSGMAVYIVYSDDNGVSWSAPRKIADYPVCAAATGYISLQYPTGKLLLPLYRSYESGSQAEFWESIDGGSTWARKSFIGSSTTSFCEPTLGWKPRGAIVDSGEEVLIAVLRDWRIDVPSISYSSDFGANWSTPIAYDQLCSTQPSLGTAHNGQLLLTSRGAYYDPSWQGLLSTSYDGILWSNQVATNTEPYATVWRSGFAYGTVLSLPMRTLVTGHEGGQIKALHLLKEDFGFRKYSGWLCRDRTTTNSYTDTEVVDISHFQSVTIWVHNSRLSNSLNWKVLVSSDGTNWLEVKSEAILPAASQDYTTVDSLWRFLKVQVKSTELFTPAIASITMHANE